MYLSSPWAEVLGLVGMAGKLWTCDDRTTFSFKERIVENVDVSGSKVAGSQTRTMR